MFILADNPPRTLVCYDQEAMFKAYALKYELNAEMDRRKLPEARKNGNPNPAYIDTALDSLAETVKRLQTAVGDGGPVDELRFYTHGEIASFQVGGIHMSDFRVLSGLDSTSQAQKDRFANLFAKIGALVKPDGKIVLYSCLTGRGDLGKSFVNWFSEKTGRVVGATEHFVVWHTICGYAPLSQPRASFNGGITGNVTTAIDKANNPSFMTRG